MNSVTWEEAYIQAALEVDKLKMGARVSKARKAILRQLEGSQHRAEHRPEKENGDCSKEFRCSRESLKIGSRRLR